MSTQTPRTRPEIIARAKELLALQRKALTTEQAYLHWIGSYIDFLSEHGRAMPDSRTRMEAFLSRIAQRGCAAATQNQAFNALLYLYTQVLGEELPKIQALRAKRPQTHRTALSREVTLSLLNLVQDEAGYPTRLIAHLLYGCGLRVSEPLNLRIKDLELSASRLIIRGAKGGKDRIVHLPCSLAPQIQTQIKLARAIHERDVAAGLPVHIPGALGRKYPRAPYAWQWAWLFPSRTPCKHPRTGQPCRYRMHETNVQRAVKHAARALDLDTVATPHILRHCYATHQLNTGCNIRDLQASLGHSHLETTMLYTAPEPDRLVELI